MTIIKEHRLIGNIDISTKDINANPQNVQKVTIYFREIAKDIIDIVVYPTSFDKANKVIILPDDDSKWPINVGMSNMNWIGRNRARDIYKYMVQNHNFKQEYSQ